MTTTIEAVRGALPAGRHANVGGGQAHAAAQQDRRDVAQPEGERTILPAEGLHRFPPSTDRAREGQHDSSELSRRSAVSFARFFNLGYCRGQ